MSSGRPRPADCCLVIFGANGDLAHRKLLPALIHLFAEEMMPRDFRIIGTSRRGMSDDEFRNFVRDSSERFCRGELSEERWAAFAERLSYIGSDFEPGDTDALKAAVESAEAALGDDAERIFYLAVPPAAFATITSGLGASGLSEGARVVFEKPFGSDLASFRSLDALVHETLDESQIFRIDHYLGKETVQNILALRFANGMFEPVWNRDHIDHVQIDVSETEGIGSRAGFYENTGALRDMIVTHLFQVLAFIALEPPSVLTSKALLDEKVKVFEAVRSLDPDAVVRGQYAGYRDAEGVAPDSDTETFAACEIAIDNWRWSGVPFFLRTGKEMAERRSSVTLAFKQPPLALFPDPPARRFGHDHLTLELGPKEGVAASFLVKRPGAEIKLATARMDFAYEDTFSSQLIEAYERLLHDAMLGDPTLFLRGDLIERGWAIVEDVLKRPPPAQPYDDGTWGPEAMNDLIAPRRWHNPAATH